MENVTLQQIRKVGNARYNHRGQPNTVWRQVDAGNKILIGQHRQDNAADGKELGKRNHLVVLHALGQFREGVFQLGEEQDGHYDHDVEFIIELERKELSLWRQGKIITLNLIKDEFKNSTDVSFLSFARKEIDASQLKDSTKQNHLTTIGLLQSFKPSIEFKDLNYNFITSFEKYLYDAGYQMNTVAKHMKHLKSFVNAAINKGYIDLNDYAFRRYKIKMKEGKHVFLLPDEMKRLEELSLMNRDIHFQHTLDAFLFCCYTGLRYSDFTNLTEKNIVKIDRELWLIFNSVKTGIEVKLPLNLLFGGKALNILYKYQNQWNTFFSLKSNSNVNKELIRIGKLANIDKHFSFHTARHTNATLLIYKGANITTVQKLLGHKNLTTTQIYGEVMGSTIVRDLKKCQKGKD